MELNAVYRKTQKGQEEIAQRTVLGMRERTLLVMVDGKATVADLLARAQHMPDPPALLAKLIDGGFIATDAVAAPNPAAASAPAQAPAQAQAPAAPLEQQVMQQTMRYAEHFLDEVLGPQSEVLAEAIGKCKTLPELRARLEKTRDVIEGMGKKRRAEEFWVAVQALLEGKAPAAAPSAAVPQAAAAPVPAAAAVPPPPAATPAPQPSIPEAMRFARRYLNDALGPNADTLLEAIERCKTLSELRAAMEKTRDALAAGGSKRKAEEFWKGVELRLPSS
jgi:hypothetical protein